LRARPRRRSRLRAGRGNCAGNRVRARKRSTRRRRLGRQFHGRDGDSDARRARRRRRRRPHQPRAPTVFVDRAAHAPAAGSDGAIAMKPRGTGGEHSDALLALSAVELRRRVGTKGISPVELLEASIARIEALNPAVNAIAAIDLERARVLARNAESAARKGEPLGALHGLPTGIKDLHETAGLLTTYGSPLYRGFVPARDAAMVALVRKAGAIILAKTNVPEFGAGANTRNVVWGATGNPFDPRLNAGGSSGGSAVALACDMLPVCTGSDTGGSLRIPAAICGVTGFRPSPGVVPMDGRPLGWTPISVLGPLGRSVADLRLLFSAQIGMDDREPLAFPLDPVAIATARPVDLGRLRMAFTEDFGQCPVSAEVRRVFRSRIAAMRHLFSTCDEVKFDF